MTGISGVGVTVASAGALLIYAGLKDVNPLYALRAVASGNPDAIANINGSRSKATTNGGGNSILVGPGFPQLLQSAQQFKGDQYSQARRWEPGYSDCSSFVGKAFKAEGIKPPGASTCVEYLAWGALKKIPQDNLLKTIVGPGDLLISTSHMAIVVDDNLAMGQQNRRENVRVDTWKNIMAGTGAYGVYHYLPGSQLEA
jgi:cell wall-associated NlpC family hydrolase